MRMGSCAGIGATVVVTIQWILETISVELPILLPW